LEYLPPKIDADYCLLREFSCQSSPTVVKNRRSELQVGNLYEDRPTNAHTGVLPELLTIYHLLGDPALNLRQ
jgi:hypothetical protein